MEQNPTIRVKCTIASTPPHIITSAAPRRMYSVASPIAWVPVAQADTTVLIGPVAAAHVLT